MDLVPLAFRKRFPKDQEWTGAVEEKTQSKSRLLSKYNTVVLFRREDGSHAQIAVPESVAADHEIGRRYRKSRGETLPRPI